MKYIKKYEEVDWTELNSYKFREDNNLLLPSDHVAIIKQKYKKGDYIIFNETKYSNISAGKPYEIIGITDNNFELSVNIYDDKEEKRNVTFFDKSMRKIPKDEALMLLAKQKYNV